jgi:DNA-binding XRE family transcriptional regulator
LGLDVKGFQKPWFQTPHLRSIDPMPRGVPTLSLREIFARNVRLVRVNAGVSQERLANDAGVDRAFVGSVERGLRNISIDYVEMLAQAIGAPAHELMNPDMPQQRGLDVTLRRAPRTARPYPAKKRSTRR